MSWHPISIMGVALCGALSLAGCDWPRDQQGTLEGVSGRTILVGVAENPDQMAMERELLEALAARQDAVLEFVPGDTSELIDELEHGAIHLIASLPESTPYGSRIGLTRPFCNSAWNEPRRVWAVMAGENAWLMAVESQLEGVRCP